MAEIQAKDKLTLLKAYFRSNPYPIDADMVKDSIDAAQTYAQGATAYAGQMLTALNTDTNKYELYVLQPGDSGYTLEKPGVDAAALKQYVMVVDSLPASNQVEGVLYINKTDNTGSIWVNSAWQEVFADVSDDVADFESRIGALETNIETKAPINNPTFTGTVTLAADPTGDLQAATKQYVDRLVDGLVDCTPGIADLTDHPLPDEGYKAGQTWRVAADGVYAGQECEVGDLIICLTDYAEGTASNADFMIVQANVDGAVTSSVDASTDGHIVVFDGITGKVIKSSNVAVASLSDAISKAHEHTNKTQLDTYTKNQTELLADAQSTAQGLVDTLAATVANKADKGDSLADYGITDAYTKTDVDSIKSTLESAINGKVDSSTVQGMIDTAVGEIGDMDIKAYIDQQDTVLSNKIGIVPEEYTSVIDYVNHLSLGGEAGEEVQSMIDQAIGNIGDDPDVATYVTNQISLACNVVEF